jgi:hypothetical protein
MLAEAIDDLLRITCGGDDGIALLECEVGDEGAKATRCAGDEPGLYGGNPFALCRCRKGRSA